MNKVRKIAGDLLAKYPTMFSTNFEANKKALEQVAIIRNRALRNQIAGAITSMASELAPPEKEEGAGLELQDVISSADSSTSSEDGSSGSGAAAANSQVRQAEQVSQQA